MECQVVAYNPTSSSSAEVHGVNVNLLLGVFCLAVASTVV